MRTCDEHDTVLQALTQLRDAPPGVPLSSPVRADLERAYGTDLTQVRLHSDGWAARLCELAGAEAITHGSDIYFADGLDPESDEARWLLNHELAHVMQQGAGRLPGRAVSYQALEHAADRVADLAVAGRPLPAAYRAVPVTRQARELAVQCHDSFEHRALGDVPTNDLRAVAQPPSPQRTAVLQRQLDLLWKWHQNPQAVTEADVRAVDPSIRTLRLPGSGLLVTYGELNALPDYLPTAATADTTSYEILLPILQFIRQEGWIQLNKLLGRSVSDRFVDSVFTPNQWWPGLINTLLGSQALDDLTRFFGDQGTDHYSALLGRNACHFAPFAWYRWQSSYMIARDLAVRSYQSRDSAAKAELARQAWVQVGYADHFLQDSFAAGHLVNKTLIMQWFIEWAAHQSLVPVADWDIVKRMTTALQPNLAGRWLYRLDFPGPSNDPQSSEDLATYQQRLSNTGVQVGGSGDLGTAYQDYLTLMSNLITQSSSAAIHDYYNSHSLWVASRAHPAAYEVWGDDTLLSGANGTEGVVETSSTSQLSQQSIRELLSRGDTGIGTADIRAHFPSQVRVGGQQLISLEAWNDTQRDFCAREIFPKLHDIIVRIVSPRIGNISKDQDLAVRWNTSLPSSGYHVTTPLQVGNRLFVASNGYLYELDPDYGSVRSSLLVTGSVGVGDYETRLASDGSTIFVGVHGYVYGVRLDNPGRVAWTCSLPRAGYLVVDVLAANGRVYACSNGYLYELDARTGSVQHSKLLGSAVGSGDYTARMYSLGSSILVGMHGYAYRVESGSLRVSWSSSLPKAGYHQVAVLSRNGRVWAGSNGYAYELDAGSGRVLHALLVSSAVGAGDYTSSLAADDAQLYVATHGYVYAISFGDWSRPRWTANLAGNRYEQAELVRSSSQLLAGSYGYLYRIDPGNGRVVRNALLASAVGLGDYRTRLVLDQSGRNAFVGSHGYSYRVATVTG